MHLGCPRFRSFALDWLVDYDINQKIFIFHNLSITHFHFIQTPVQSLRNPTSSFSYFPDLTPSFPLFTLLHTYWPSCWSSTCQAGACFVDFALAAFPTWIFLPPDLCTTALSRHSVLGSVLNREVLPDLPTSTHSSPLFSLIFFLELIAGWYYSFVYLFIVYLCHENLSSTLSCSSTLSVRHRIVLTTLALNTFLFKGDMTYITSSLEIKYFNKV